MEKVKLTGLSADEIYGLIEPGGFTREHALKISNSLYKKGVSDLSIIPGVSRHLKEYLQERSEPGICEPLSSSSSADGSVKFLFSGRPNIKFETVFIPEEERKTVCVSTQSGCRMGCSFCATGKYGFHGDLGAGEIVNQVIVCQRISPITHVVFMGMGEPLDNTDNVLKACELLTAEWGMAISPRNITVSTVGITPAIVRFLEQSPCNLVVSLYSPFASERAKMVPAEKKYPVREIIRIMAGFPLKKKRRLSIAYMMLKGINDTEQHLEEIRKILSGTGIRVNLLPYHRLPGDEHSSSEPGLMDHFRQELMNSGISASVRRSRGADISAACGLLASGLSPESDI
ncbi:MAG: radical SAM protein [Bacteroidales bacterium]|nr:radical SAM protein [Bacteroidales bacterium]MBN2632870.1 radical SAM protein [Bacteroidales bacterium]